ncbi:protein kibra [Chironomus tepperi]|uniref:protein kibra n=1 Tax=Chironomus tepperi TaxID=113505 RepID=UPI00391F2330
MPKSMNKNEDLPLPYNWERGQDYDGKVYYIDHTRKITTWIDPRDRYTKPETFADCIGNELPLGWEESYDQQIGVFYINHNNQCTQLEDPRLEWRDMQEQMLKEYVSSAEEQLEAKKEIYDIKQQRLLLAQDEYNHLNALATSRTSLCSSASSCSTKFDPDLLRADLALAKERVNRLRKEMARIQNEMSYTQKGVETLHSVEQKLNSHQNGCYSINEAQAILEEVKKIQKSLLLGEKEKKELMHSLAQVKEDLTRLQLRQESPDASTFNLSDRVSAASQTDICLDAFPIGAREMAKLRMKYDEYRKKVKDIQEKLASLEERIRPGELESDQDRLLLFQEKKQLLMEYRSISPRSRTEEEMTKIKALCKKLESDLNNAYEESNQCIANRLKLHEEKQMLLQELLDALREVTHLENQLKSVSASTLSISSSGSSLGSLSTASSKGSLSGISFTDIYGDPLMTDPRVDMVDLSRQIQYFLPPSTSEISLSSRSSLSTAETPPASPLRQEPMYENAQEALAAALFEVMPSTSQQQQNILLDCNRLKEHLQEYAKQKRLSPINEKGLLHIPQSVLSRSSSASNTVSAAVSDESVAGDSGVFEASRASTQIKESAQIQVTLKYLTEECALLITIERARNLTVLGLPSGCQLYIKAILLPVVSGNSVILRTKTFNEFLKPVFGASVQIPISLSKVYTKSLQIKIMMLLSQKEDWVGSAQISLAEFSTHQDGNSKWYNIISRENMNETEVEENFGAAKEESSDESTVISSQTSTLTRNQGHDEMQQAVLAMSLQEQLCYCSDEEESDEEEGNDEACGGKLDEVYDDDSTAQMIETYMNEVQSYSVMNIETVDAQTNTENLPDYQQRTLMLRLRERTSASTTSLRDPKIYPIEDRSSLVKRSQTFSPSAACNKSRYICRRSDSDSAMHFNITAAVSAQPQPHPFRRGAVERRSLRYHGKAPRVLAKAAPGLPPRTSIDLELDLKAQQSRLESLNDQITKLRELKHRLEQARDANDIQIANWALENDEFKSLINECNINSEEDRRVQKLFRKTSKEIYKLRKAKVDKTKPDMISFKEKMAFFIRRGTSLVPEIPTNNATNNNSNDREISEEDARKYSYVLDRDGVEV